MAKKESSTTALVKKVKGSGKAKKHPNKKECKKKYNSQGR
jgi:hypothetical protein